MNYIVFTELLFVIVICALMLLKRNKKASDWWLLGFFIVLFFNDFYNWLHASTDLHWFHLVTITLCPVFFRFNLATLQSKTIPIKLYFSFVPFALFIPMLLFYRINQDNFLFRIFIFTVVLVMILHGAIALLLLRQIPPTIKQNDKQWSVWFAWSYFLYFSISVIMGMAVDDSISAQNNIFEYVNNILSLIAIVLVGYAGYRFGILYPLAETKPMVNIENEKLEFYQKIYEKTDTLISDKKLYLKSDLSMADICKFLSVNQKYISQAINLHYGAGFNQYINEKRIEEFEIKLNDPHYKNYSLAALSEECGFSSSSSFNRIFKSIKTVTPSKFREHILNR